MHDERKDSRGRQDPGAGAGVLFRRDTLFPAAILFFCIARQMLVIGMPVFVRGSTCDDVLMIGMADGLSKGQWLGDYNCLTLMKGCFYPVFVAAAYKLRIPALHAITALHTLACGFFVFQLRPLICNSWQIQNSQKSGISREAQKSLISRETRNSWKCLLLFVLLLFEPASFAERTFQADYRNSLTILQVLFLFGAVFGLYLNYGKKRLWDFLKAVFIGLSLVSFWNTREDAIWVLPFVLVGMIFVLVRAIWMAGREWRLKKILFAGFLCVIPFAFLLGGNELIRQKNREVYGLPILLEASEGKFAHALRSIYSVRNEEELQYMSVSREKLERLYAASPSLRSIRGKLDMHLVKYDRADRHPGDGEVEDGWFLWALRRAAFDTGRTRSLAEAELYRQAF